jgi:predicted alpha/beta-fold hydrolase
LQTLYAYFLKRETPLCLRRERWETPDNDFIDLDWLDSSNVGANLLVLFHGLEGCSSSHYARSLMNHARRRHWRGVISHFRGCSGEHNRLARAYHSGDSSEIDWILRRLKENNPAAKIYPIGVSLGGNVLLKWLGEQGDRALALVEKAAAVSAPVELAAAADVLDRGCRKLIYTSYFLRTLKQKSLYKITQHRLKIDLRQVRAASTFRQFDDLFTAPVHGFDSADDYWAISAFQLCCSTRATIRFFRLLHCRMPKKFPPASFWNIQIPAVTLDSYPDDFRAVSNGSHDAFLISSMPGSNIPCAAIAFSTWFRE